MRPLPSALRHCGAHSPDRTFTSSLRQAPARNAAPLFHLRARRLQCPASGRCAVSAPVCDPPVSQAPTASGQPGRALVPPVPKTAGPYRLGPHRSHSAGSGRHVPPTLSLRPAGGERTDFSDTRAGRRSGPHTAAAWKSPQSSTGLRAAATIPGPVCRLSRPFRSRRRRCGNSGSEPSWNAGGFSSC